MRLIDADELMEHVWRDRLDSRELIAKMIDNAPTVKEISQEPKTDMLDKIRAEIEQTVSRYSISRERGYTGQVEWSDRLIKESEVLQIIDKYKAILTGAEKEYKIEVKTRGNCMICGKELTEGLFFCKECENKLLKM